MDRRIMGQLGPFGLVRELARAPGAWLVEAVHEGAAVGLQLARLRAATDDDDARARERYEAELGGLSALLAQEPDLGLRARGAMDRPDGSRLLHWTVELTPALRTLDQTARTLTTPEALTRAGLALAHRLVRRHALGRLEPLLCEDLVTVAHGAASAALAGVPVFVSPEWAAPGTPPTRLAPEEATTLAPTRAGDVWRLGRTLEALGAHLERLPPALRGCLGRLTASDPARRVQRATDAVVELEAVLVELAIEAGFSAAHSAETASLGMLDAEVVTSLLAATAAESTQLAAQPLGERGAEEATTTRGEAIASIDRFTRARRARRRSLEAPLELRFDLDAAATEPLPPAPAGRPSPASGVFPASALRPLRVSAEDSAALESLAPFVHAALTTGEYAAAPLPGERSVRARPALDLEQVGEPSVDPPLGATPRREATPPPALHGSGDAPPAFEPIELPLRAGAPPRAVDEPSSPWSPTPRSAPVGPRLDAASAAAFAEPLARPRAQPKVELEDLRFLRGSAAELDDEVTRELLRLRPAMARRWTAGLVLAGLSAAGLLAFLLAAR